MTRLEIAARIAAGLAAHLNFPTDETPKRALSMADELIKLEAETRPKPKPEPAELPFEMVVGGVYERRNGEIEEIVEKIDFRDYPFMGASGVTYSIKGLWRKDIMHRYDLVKRIR